GRWPFRGGAAGPGCEWRDSLVPPESARCRRCGTLLSDTGRFCPDCATRTEQEPPGLSALKVLSAILVAIVAIFLAALGSCLVIAGVGSLGQGLSGLGL